MKPKPVYSRKTGEIVSYQIRCSIKQKFYTKTWAPDKKYTPAQLEKELERQTILFEQQTRERLQKETTVQGLSTMLFSDYADKWIKEYSIPNHKLKTTESYESMLKRVKVAIGHIPLNQITTMVINNFLLNLREPGTKITGRSKEASVSPKTVKNFHTLLRSMFNTAVEWKILDENPVDGVKPPKVRKKEIPVLEKEEVIKLFNCLQEAPLKYNVFFQLAILSGMRRGEILGLKWSCVDFKNCTITVKTTSLYSPKVGQFEDTPKTEGSERVLKISKSFFDLLAIFKQEQDKNRLAMGDKWHETDYVFTAPDGRPLHPNGLYNWFIRFQKKHGLERCSIHALRHTNATLLIMEGANIKLVSSRLGHTNTSTTTNIYASYLKSADEAAAKALDEILGLNKDSSEKTKKRFKINRTFDTIKSS